MSWRKKSKWLEMKKKKLSQKQKKIRKKEWKVQVVVVTSVKLYFFSHFPCNFFLHVFFIYTQQQISLMLIECLTNVLTWINFGKKFNLFLKILPFFQFQINQKNQQFNAVSRLYLRQRSFRLVSMKIHCSNSIAAAS